MLRARFLRGDLAEALSLDHKDNVWITASNPGDTHILKFTRTGKFLLQISRKGTSGGSNDTANLGRPAQARVDSETNEVYVADGEGENHRVIVFDADTGAYTRHWGAYGRVRPPTETACRSLSTKETGVRRQEKFGDLVSPMQQITRSPIRS